MKLIKLQVGCIYEFTLIIIRARLQFVICLHGRKVGVMLVELTSCAGVLYGEQVKVSTPKLRQNKEKNKNSDF